MSNFNESLSRVSSLLLNPKSQKPTLDLRWTQLSYEMQNLYNELDSTGLPWTYNDVSISVTSGQLDYLLANVTGKILFVIAYPENTAYGPVSLEFADLADVSSDFFLYSPLDWGFAPDFNEAVNFPFPFNIAFYRKDGDVWFRLPPFAYTLTSIKIVYSTGDWLQNLQPENTAVLSQHHALPEVRTALNLLPGCEWVNESVVTTANTRVVGNANQNTRQNLDRSLSRQEARYAQQFMYAKREMTDSEVSERVAFGGGW